MDTLTQYREAIKTLIERHAALKPRGETVERQMLFDNEHAHYQLLNVGWSNTRRIYHCVMHFDLKDGKVWIQQNSTDIDLDEELIELGVAREDIIIGFIPVAWQENAQVEENRVAANI